ncbi:uncharacterized protein FRV6_13614 [Fusarium oxysporum]
MIIPT